jgi:hypothetical protein
MTDQIKSSLLSLWLGAALFFSAVVAPSVFGVLRQFNLSNANEIAGNIVTRTLTVINVSGFLIGLVLLAATLIWKKSSGFAFAIQVLSLAVLTIATSVGHWIVAARMLLLRTAMVVPIDRVAADDPRRQVFNKLHGYSVGLLSAAMIASVVAIGVGLANRRSGKGKASR